MSLRTDYKNDIYTGKRKYLLTDNGDGTYEIDDVTQYLQNGDVFSADDINETNAAVNQNTLDIEQTSLALENGLKKAELDLESGLSSLKDVKYATFPAAGWSASAPYTQTVNVAGITAADTPIVSLYLSAGLSAADVKAKAKAFGYVDRAVTGNGTITVHCYNSKPDVEFQIAIKGE